MSRTFLHSDIRWLRRTIVIATLAAIATATPAIAQDSLGDAVLALWNKAPVNGNIREVDAALFGAAIHLRVNGGDRPTDSRSLKDTDYVSEFSISRGGRTLDFVVDPQTGTRGGTGKEFKQWVQNNAATLVRDYLFPTSVSASVSGKDAAQNQAQQFLLTTAMTVAAARETARQTRAGSGGLFEVENLSSEDTALGIMRSTLALQGMYDIQPAHLSVTGRFSQQREETALRGSAAAATQSVMVATDFHPSVSVNPDLDWRIGIDARTGLLATRASTLTFGSIDYGGGVWTSARKDFSRVRIGAGTLVQGSKSYVPGAIKSADVQELADTITHAPIAWDVSYGVIGGYAVTSQTSLNGKLLQTRPFMQNGMSRPDTTIVMGSVSHLVGGLTPVDVGYKYSTTGNIRSHGVFVQGSYGW